MYIIDVFYEYSDEPCTKITLPIGIPQQLKVLKFEECEPSQTLPCEHAMTKQCDYNYVSWYVWQLLLTVFWFFN